MRARDYRRIAREKLSGNWGISIAVGLVATLLGGLISDTGGFSVSVSEEIIPHLPEFLITYIKITASVSSVLAIVAFIIGGTLQLGYARYLINQHNGAGFEFKDLFSQFYQFGNGFLQFLLRLIYTFLWCLLFIIPGVVKAYAYAMTPFILAEHPEYSANEAITKSKEMMNGHKAELFFLDLSFIGWILLNVLTLGIGTLFLVPYTHASYAAFYKHLIQGTSVEY